MFRFSLPYKVGELGYPGNADEKLRCEAAMYIYIQENCPDVPILKLWGFGFKNGSIVRLHLVSLIDTYQQHSLQHLRMLQFLLFNSLLLQSKSLVVSISTA